MKNNMLILVALAASFSLSYGSHVYTGNVGKETTVKTCDMPIFGKDHKVNYRVFYRNEDNNAQALGCSDDTLDQIDQSLDNCNVETRRINALQELFSAHSAENICEQAKALAKIRFGKDDIESVNRCLFSILDENQKNIIALQKQENEKSKQGQKDNPQAYLDLFRFKIRAIQQIRASGMYEVDLEALRKKYYSFG